MKFLPKKLKNWQYLPEKKHHYEQKSAHYSGPRGIFRAKGKVVDGERRFWVEEYKRLGWKVVGEYRNFRDAKEAAYELAGFEGSPPTTGEIANEMRQHFKRLDHMMRRWFDFS